MAVDFELEAPGFAPSETSTWHSRWLNMVYEKLRGPLWEDMISPIVSSGRRGAATDFDWTEYNGTGIYQPDFAVGEDGVINFHITHDTKPNSKMYPHMHWSTSGTDVNPVHWEWNYIWATRNDTSPTTFSAKQTVTFIGTPTGTAFQHIVTEVSDAYAITMPEVDSILIGQIKRVTNSATENTDTVLGHFMDIHYQKDRFGTPQKAPNFYAR